MAVQTYPAKVLLFIQDPQAILDAGYDKISIERRKTLTGSFVEITNTSTRIPVEAGKYNYFYLDEDAEPGWEYEPVLIDDGAVEPDVRQGIVKPVDASYEYVLTIDELKDIYLYGLDDALSNDSGVPIPDYVYAHYIQAAIAKFEQKTAVRVMPTRFIDYHDYIREDAQTFFATFLDEFPVIEVEEFALTLPGQSAQAFPASWLQVDKDSGQIHVLPTADNQGPIFGPANPWFGGIRSDKWLPRAVRVTYFAGFLPGQLPHNIKDVIGKEASFGPLNLGGDLLGGAGIASQSISLDGLSTSFNTTSSATNAGFGARIIQYTKELKDQYPEIIKYYKGLRLRVL